MSSKSDGKYLESIKRTFETGAFHAFAQESKGHLFKYCFQKDIFVSQIQVLFSMTLHNVKCHSTEINYCSI